MKIFLYLAFILLALFVAQKADAVTLTAIPRNDHFGPNDWLYVDLKIDGYTGGKVSWVATRPDNSTFSGTLEQFPGGTKVHLIPRNAFDNYFGNWFVNYTYNDVKKTIKFVVDPIVLSARLDKYTYYSGEIMKMNITTSYFIADATRAQTYHLIFYDKKGNPAKNVEKIDHAALSASRLVEFPISEIIHNNPLGQYKVKLQYYNTIVEVPFEIGDISKRLTISVNMDKAVYNVGDPLGINLVFSRTKEAETIIRVIDPSGIITTHEFPVTSAITRLQLSNVTAATGKYNLEVEYSGIKQAASFEVKLPSKIIPIADLFLDKIKYRPGEIINARFHTASLITNSSNVWLEDPNRENGTVSVVPITSTDTIFPHKISKNATQGTWKMYVNYGGFTTYATFFAGGLPIDALDIASFHILPAPRLLMKIDSEANVQFNNPIGIAADSSGNIYIVDSGDSQIKKLSPSGKLLVSWGSYGAENGQFKDPSGILVDKKYVYVADTGNARIQKFDKNGNFIYKWGSFSDLPGMFQTPVALAASKYGDLFVSDSSSNKILIFNSDGLYKDEIKSPLTDDQKFSSSNSIALDSKNNFYIAISEDNKILQYSSIDAFIKSIGSYGQGKGQFNNPSSIAVDSNGNLYVADTNNYRIQKFDSDGKLLTSWGSLGAGPGQFTRPVGLAIDDKNNLYVLDTVNKNIQKFAPYSSPDEVIIPDWVISHAKWWAKNRISDSDFAEGIQYLIRQNIISIPKGEMGSTAYKIVIPQWVKTTTGWWADRLVSDKDFVSGIQYLISRDIIKV